MILYLDTSVVVALLTRDIFAARADALITRRDGDTLCISRWTIPEVSSALARLVRMKLIKSVNRDQTITKFEWLRASSLETLSIEEPYFARAALLVDRSAAGLRAPDALHLAIAEAAGAALVTFDDRLAEAAREIGLRVDAL